MKDTRTSREKRNIAASLANQLVSTVCGILVPRVMIGAFGSVVYGATTSIAQFLSYISLLEGGIGRVARGALYGPLARGDDREVSKVYRAVKSFFSSVGRAFLIYTLVLSLVYHDIAGITVFTRDYTFLLVWAISFATLAKYLWGLPSITLLNADQRQYITNSVIMVSTVVNVLLIVLLTWMGCNVVVVKLGSSLVFVARPLVLSLYVKRHYRLPKVEKDDSVLEQKWTGLGQHLAYTIHTNTDVVILTLFADLSLVSVYSVYYLVINSIRNIASSFAGGMEAVFGEMIAKGEQQELQGAYRRYKVLLSTVSMVLFGATAILILSFVRLYTAGISDADYIQPVFALVLLLAEAVNCIMLPCTTLPISANRLRQTRLGAYGEAILNLGVSCVLVFWNPLVGVALGTLIASLCKSVYYMVYTARHILKCRLMPMLLRFGLTLVCWTAVAVGGMRIIQLVEITNFLQWAVAGVGAVAVMGVFSLAVNGAMYPREMKALLGSVVRKVR